MKREESGQFWRIIWRTLVHYGRHNSHIMAAGMSFFGMLSLVPLTVLGVSLLGYFLDSSEDAQQFVSRILLENFPSSAEEMLNQISTIIATPKRNLVNGLSLLGLVWSGMRFFHILQRVLNNVWVGATQRRFFRGRLTALVSFIAAGLLFWGSFVFTSSITVVRQLSITSGTITLLNLHKVWFILEWSVSFVASTVTLFLVYMFVPHTKVSRKAACMGAVFASIFLQLSRWAFSFIVVRFDVYGRVYGPLASVIMFMSWLYLSMTIVLLGAELGSQCQELLFDARSEAEAE